MSEQQRPASPGLSEVAAPPRMRPGDYSATAEVTPELLL